MSDDPNRITVNIRGADGADTSFRLKRTAKVDKLLSAYASRIDANADELRILFDGVRLEGGKTLNDYDLEDGDTLDCLRDVRPDTAPNDSNTHITLIIRGTDGTDTTFKFKRTTKFAKLKNAYAKRMGLHVSSLKLYFDGLSLEDEKTPHDYDMEDNDRIENYVPSGCRAVRTDDSGGWQFRGGLWLLGYSQPRIGMAGSGGGALSSEGPSLPRRSRPRAASEAC
jgi:small ubiquitin-related modifier